MIVYIAFILFWVFIILLVYWTWQAERKKQPKGKYVLKKLLPFAVIIAMAGTSYYVVNYLVKPPDTNDPYVLIYRGSKLKNTNWQAVGYNILMKQYPDNADYFMSYVRHSIADVHTLNNDIESQLLSTLNRNTSLQNKEAIYLGLAYYYAETSNTIKAVNNLSLLNSDTIKYANYIKGIIFEQKGQTDSALNALYSEINNPGNIEWTYHYLAYFLIHHNYPDDLVALASDVKAWKYLPFSYMSDIYIKNNLFGAYVYSTYNYVVINTNWVDFLAALLVTLVWLYFLYRIDIYESENWQHILMVLSTAMLLTPLTLMLSDMEEIYFGIRETGEPLNDFLYCTFSIGLREEFIKIIPLLLLLKFTKAINEPYDYILYASISALGFAFVENLLYFDPNSISIVTGRALTSTVAHMFFTSIITYGLILAKYKWEGKYPTWLVFIGFFLLAALAHGFYDFWLINAWASQYSILTIIFFLASINIWFSFKNNALGNSTFFNPKIIMDEDLLRRILVFGLFGVLCFEYIALGILYTPKYSNEVIFNGWWFNAILIFILTFNLTNYSIRKGKWNPINFSVGLRGVGFSYISAFSGGYFSQGKITEKIDWTGWKVEVNNYKYNKNLRSYLPWTGIIEKYIKINGREGWHLLKLDAPLEIKGADPNYILVQQSNSGGELKHESQLQLIAFLILDMAQVKKGKASSGTMLKLGWVILDRIWEEDEEVKEVKIIYH